MECIQIAMVIFCRKMTNAPAIKINGKTVDIVIYDIVFTIVFSVAMCMTMVWEHFMTQGIIVGIIGIVLLLGLIPMIKEIK